MLIIILLNTLYYMLGLELYLNIHATNVLTNLAMCHAKQLCLQHVLLSKIPKEPIVTMVEHDEN